MGQRNSLFGVNIDVLSMSESVNEIVNWIEKTDTDSAQIVVTPNVDHVVMLQSNRQLNAVYEDAGLVLADGFPLILAAKLLGKPLPERVAGSELVPALFDRVADRKSATSVYLLGAMPGVAVKAARRIDRDWPYLKVVGTYSPPLGFEKDEAECSAILDRIEAASPDILILGVGAPKQELWAHRFQSRIKAKTVLCIGATIDFLAGEKAQAPVWMRRTGLEWLHRCITEPRRLFLRDMKGAVVFPQIVFREWRAG